MLPYLALMVVRDLDVIRIPFGPTEADTPLIVNPDAELSLTITVQTLKSIPRRYT
jgi:hypothetical protein